MTRTNVITLICGVIWSLTAFQSVSGWADEAVDKAFAALPTYDWGVDRAVLVPLEDAVVAAHDNAQQRIDLEKKLTAVLSSDAPAAAKVFVCRQLSLIGGADSVPVLARLLGDAKLSHMARYALQRIPNESAGNALRDALSRVDGSLRIGVISSLGARRDAGSVPMLKELLSDSDRATQKAAAAALGSIGNEVAAASLGDAFTDAKPDQQAFLADPYLACAERLLKEGKKTEALAIYKRLNRPELPKHVRLAATRGMLNAMKSR